jgi:hypothetical protein
MDFAVWQMLLKQTQHWQRVNHIAERTWFEDEDFQTQ